MPVIAPSTTAITQSPGAGRAATIGLFLLAIALGLFAAFGSVRFWKSHLGQDPAWYIYAAELMLKGAKLYGPEIFETNPPFSLWLTIIPVWIAGVLHVDSIVAFRIGSLITIFGCFFWTVLLLRRMVPGKRYIVWASAAAFLYGSLVLVQGDSFAQREHFAMVLMLPYLVMRAMRCRGQATGLSEALFIGIAAAIAVCLKPQQIVVIVAVEFLALFYRHKGRAVLHPSLLAFAAGLLLYFASIRLFASSYLTKLLPLLVDAYWGFDVPLRAELHTAAIWIIVLCLSSAMYFFFRKRLVSEPLIPFLIVSAVAALVAFLQQHKNFLYHIIPAQFFIVMAVGVLVGEALSAYGSRSNRAVASPIREGTFTVTAVVSFAIAVVCTSIFLPRPGYSPPQKADVARIFSAYPPGTHVGFISDAPFENPTVLERDLVWSFRYPHFWMIPAIILSQDPQPPNLRKHLSAARVAELAQLQLQQTSEDLARWKPAVVVIDECGTPTGCNSLNREGYPTLLAWFQQSPLFRAQWAPYVYQQSMGRLDVFARKDKPAVSTPSR